MKLRRRWPARRGIMPREGGKAFVAGSVWIKAATKISYFLWSLEELPLSTLFAEFGGVPTV